MKRYFSALIVALLAVPIISSLPAHAATTVPATVQVKDPVDDANGLNDQDNAYGTPAEGQGDHTSAKDAGSATDFEDIWYTNDAETVSLHIHTQAPPSNLAEDVYFRVASNPGKGDKGSDATRGCIFWTAYFNGTAGAYTGPDSASVTDSCNVGTATDAQVTLETLDDTTGIITLTVPRSYSPLFVDGSTLTKTYGVARVLVVGPTPTTATAVTSDTTQRGTDYALASGGESQTPPPAPKPPKPCKAKGVAKGCKANKPPASSGCAAYQPGDLGKDAKGAVVTDAATKDKPLSETITAPPGAGTVGGLPGNPNGPLFGHTYFNVQVDPAAATTGLYASVEFPAGRDYDMYLYNPDGSEAARSAGGNQATQVPGNDGTGNGGHSTLTSENFDGIKSNDCQGYTIDVVTADGEGGDLTLKLWLGDATYDPSAPTSGAAKPI